MAIPGKVPCSPPRAPFLPGDQEQARPLPSLLTGLGAAWPGVLGQQGHESTLAFALQAGIYKRMPRRHL